MSRSKFQKLSSTNRLGIGLCLHAIVMVIIFAIGQCLAATVDDGFQVDNGGSENQIVEPSSQAVAAPVRDSKHYEKTIRPILEANCFDCHSEDNVEGNFRADTLDPDLVKGDDIHLWLEVYSVLSNDEMPPPDSSELTDEHRAQVVEWLAGEIQAAEKMRTDGESGTSFRRLTRYEYNYALQDLLGVPWTFADDLPAESSEEDAFENNAESLHMSVKQVETYHKIALNALRRTTVRGEQPGALYWSIPMKLNFDREYELQSKKLERIKKDFEGGPEKLAARLERIKNSLKGVASKTHYFDIETGERRNNRWEYFGAPYAHEPTESFQRVPEDQDHFAVVQPGKKQGLVVELGDRLPDEGMMRIRVRASRATGSQKRVPSLQLSFGFQSTNEGATIQPISKHDTPIEASFGSAEFYQWDISLSELEHRNTYRGKRKMGEQPSPSEYIRFDNSTIKQKGDDDFDSLAVLIDYVEISAPTFDQWPPRSHRDIFIQRTGGRGDSDIADADGSDNGELSAEAEVAYAEEIVSAFMTKAWRGTPTSDDLDRKLELFKRVRPVSRDFQEAVVEVLATVLTSPRFLYVLPGQSGEGPVDSQEDNRLSQYELATRLSLFFWCSLPDQELLDLAAANRLEDDDVLQQQIDRMLADSRSSRFNKHFVTQWLKMQPLEYLSPTQGKDPLDEALLESMKREPIALFTDMLKRDANILELIDSDYLVVNERLAAHYGIPEVLGNHFRRVSVPLALNRGGLLTQAGLLALNSDGKDSHPVKRGVWLLTNLLNDPPPPAPPAVPEIDLADPEIAKLTLKERIEDHRNHAACMSCHKKIDPWGIAFENYDALGRWRDEVNEKAIDASSMLPGDVDLDGINGLKKHLVEDRQEQFIRATIEKMAAFGLGRQLNFGDRAEITSIAQEVQKSGGGLRTLVICLAKSDLFRTK